MLIDSFRNYILTLEIVRRIIQSYIHGTEYQSILLELDKDIVVGIDSKDFTNSIRRLVVTIIEKEIKNLVTKTSQSTLNDYKFILAVYTDEYVIYNTDIGEKWETYLLERYFFETAVGGEKVFLLIDRFLKEKKSIDSEMSGVYYLMLCSGYYGKYRYSDSSVEIDSYKKQLLQETYISYSLVLDKNYYNPQSYQYNISTAKIVRVKDYKTLYIEISSYFSLLMLAVIVYFLIAYSG